MNNVSNISGISACLPGEEGDPADEEGPQHDAQCDERLMLSAPVRVDSLSLSQSYIYTIYMHIIIMVSNNTKVAKHEEHTAPLI